MAVAETNKGSLVSPSSSELDFHLSELEEACARFLEIVKALRSTLDNETRDTLEGDLYASLFHLKYHARPALKEWDRITEELPDDDDEEDLIEY
jgi:hypothetical protein